MRASIGNCGHQLRTGFTSRKCNMGFQFLETAIKHTVQKSPDIRNLMSVGAVFYTLGKSFNVLFPKKRINKVIIYNVG